MKIDGSFYLQSPYCYSLGEIHPLMNLHMDSTGDANRVQVKLKLAAGTYILQINWAAFNQNDVKPTCLLCNAVDETLAHILIFCKSLEQ